MSSSDDDWMYAKPKAGGGGGTSDMMAARREALRLQREAAQGRLNPQAAPAPAASRQPPVAGRLGGGDPTAVASGGAPAAAVVTTPRPKTQAEIEAEAQKATADKIEDLKLQVEAKKKQLQSTREREKALTEKWRAEKAQKRAEIHQLDAQLRKVWGSVEDEKSATESKVREAQDAHEKELRQSRQRIEQQLKEEYEPQIASLQEELRTKKEEEEKLRTLLSAQGETQDVLHTAIASALSTIMDRIQSVFTSQADDTEKWNKHLQDLVKNEVRSSFAVSIDNEAQSERDEYKRNFDDLLDFWRTAEDEVRERLVKMDDALLSDLQAVLRDDLVRLQREELSMEDIYVRSREEWVLQHQEMLRRELDATISRREVELEDYRKLRHQLHVDRLRDIEERHKDAMSMEEALHHKEMEQLRQHFSKEEQLQAQRQRVALAAQEDIANSTESLRSVVGSMESVLDSIKTYQAAVDEGRAALVAERRANLTEQEQVLQSIQGLVSSQCVAVQSENRHLHEATTKLQIVHDQVSQQLEAESTWLAQQEASYEKGKETWDREYRRWKQLLQRERASVEERFHEALTALQESTALMDAEERDVQVETEAMKHAFADIGVAVDNEVTALKDREREIDERCQTLNDTLNTLEKKGEDISVQWRAMQQDRTALAKEKDALREEEQVLQQMSHSLHVLKAQMEGMRAQTCAATERARTLTHQLQVNKDSIAVAQPSAVGPSARAYHDRADRQQALHDLERSKAKKPHRSAAQRDDQRRLPQKILQELRQQLESVHAFSASDPYADALRTVTSAKIHMMEPSSSQHRKHKELASAATHTRSSQQQQIHRQHHHSNTTPQSRQTRHHMDPYQQASLHSAQATDASTMGSHMGEASPGRTFTDLLAITDGDSASQSFQGA